MRRTLLYISALALCISVAQIILSPDFQARWESLEHAYESEEEEEEERREHGRGNTDEPGGYFKFHEGIRTRAGARGPEYKPGYKWKALYNSVNARKSNALENGAEGVTWIERGPGNVPGRTRAVFNVPGDPANNTWLAGAATGGIWRTNDGGITWSERSTGFPALPISSFAADRNATVIFAGTGESVSSFYSAIGNGIFKSTNGGVSWSQLSSTNNNPDFAIVTRLAVNPDDPNVILASTVPHNQSDDPTSAIMRSTDGGQTWQKVIEIFGRFEQVVATPTNFNVLYASENGVGVWKSVDAGVSWALSNKGMTPGGRVEIAVSALNGSSIIASAEGTISGTTSDLYYSQDAGSTWSLIDVRFNDTPVDFLDGQGYYNNTVMFDPFNARSVYIGGVGMFKTTLTSGTVAIDNYQVLENNTEAFLFLQSFQGNQYDNGRLSTGANANRNKIEIRFGPGISQKAHRFLVPTNTTTGLVPTDYNYQDYVTVPFQVWDVTANKQLMASFRDQNRNGKFDLLPSYLTDDGVNYLVNSREYLYIHDVSYASLALSSIAKNAGQQYRLMYILYPALAADATWNENSLPASNLTIEYIGISRYNASTKTVADSRGLYDQKNTANQVELTSGVHADHHALTAIVEDPVAKKYKLLLGNDGGVFVSKSTTEPGTIQGDWEFRGYGMNTGQFYGADKHPIAEEYIGGLQDNGTRISEKNEKANALTNYRFALEGDGFEVIWNSKNPKLLLGTRYYGQISKSINGGSSWEVMVSANLEYPFVTKLANSKEFPDRVFAAGSKGVYVSNDFGSTWSLTPIPSNYVIGTPFFLDVEVSRSNPSIVWAGSGMNSGAPLQRNLHVSTNGGKTFTSTNNFTDVPMGNITKLGSHPTEPNTAYALFSFSNAPKILRTTNLGQTWEDISGFGTGTSSVNGFPDVAVYCIYVRPDNPNIIWAGTEIGIVASSDNGVSWNLLDGIPHVAVWDMKGQGNEVVIATHGRGIWSAVIDAPQQSVLSPEIIAAGSTPQGEFAVRFKTAQPFDSLLLFANSTKIQRWENFNPQAIDVTVKNLEPGEKGIKLVGYRNDVPHQSMTLEVTHHDILEPKIGFSTHFRTTDEVDIKGMTTQSLEGSPQPTSKTLQTNHDYSVNETYEIFIKTPIIVSHTLPRIMYNDIAIVEPDFDSVAVEATLNGLDWVLLKGYDANLDSRWKEAYDQGRQGNYDMNVDHDLNYGGQFLNNALVLFRFRLVSGPTRSGWGWSIEQIHIQEFPTATEDPSTDELDVFPNPVGDLLTIHMPSNKGENIWLDVYSSFGAKVKSALIVPQHTGSSDYPIDFSGVPPGTYLVMIRSGERTYVRKVIRVH